MHIVERYHSTAMQKMAIPLVQYLGATIGEHSVKDDVNVHIPWHFVLEEQGGRHVIFYTHCNPGDEAKLEEACARSELVLCMSYQGRKELLDLGVPTEKIWVAYPGGDGFVPRMRNVGIVGYRQPNGRKREHLLLDLAYLLPQEVKSMVCFLMAGSGWTEIAEEARKAGLTVNVIAEHADIAKLQAMYQTCDALLVTAHVEGGPLPMVEALSCGLKVFSPPIGIGADILDDTYVGAEDLSDAISEWVQPFIERAYLGTSFSWQGYGEDIALALGELTGNTPMAEAGMPRYQQLMQVVDEVKPKSICEIGTWSGQRAAQMIQRAQRHNKDIIYTGFDVFQDSTPGLVRREFSKGFYPMQTVLKRLRPTGATIRLNRGNTNETLKGKRIKADLFYVDGGHSRETVRNDWDWVAGQIGNGVAVLDDYCVNGPDGYGCREVVESLGPEWRVEILPVITQGIHGDIQMVKVRRA